MKKITKTILLLFLFVAELYSQATQNDTFTDKARQDLGRRLFYDADLSINGTMACATCHEQRRGFCDPLTKRQKSNDQRYRLEVRGFLSADCYK